MNELKNTLGWSAERLVEHLLHEARDEIEKHEQAQMRLKTALARSTEADRAEARLTIELQGRSDELSHLLSAPIRDEQAISRCHAESSKLEAQIGEAEREAKLTRGSDGETLKAAEEEARMAGIHARQKVEKALRHLAVRRSDEFLRAIAGVFQRYMQAQQAIRRAHEQIHSEHGLLFSADVVLLPTSRGPDPERSLVQDLQIALRAADGARFLVERYYPTETPTPTAEPKTDAEPDDEPQAIEPGRSLCTSGLQ